MRLTVEIRGIKSLKAELQVVVSHSIQVLGINPVLCKSSMQF